MSPQPKRGEAAPTPVSSDAAGGDRPRSWLCEPVKLPHCDEPVRLRTNMFPIVPTFQTIAIYECGSAGFATAVAAAKAKANPLWPCFNRGTQVFSAVVSGERPDSTVNVNVRNKEREGAVRCVLVSQIQTSSGKDSTTAMLLKLTMQTMMWNMDAEIGRVPTLKGRSMHDVERLALVGRENPGWQGFAKYTYCDLFRSKSGPRVIFDIGRKMCSAKNVFELVLERLKPLKRGYKQADWERAWNAVVKGQTVVCIYNQRAHTIKAVRFDKTPDSTFSYFNREMRERSTMTFRNYIKTYYSQSFGDAGDAYEHSTSMRQPLLEAHEEKMGENPMLIPEVCVLLQTNEPAPSRSRIGAPLPTAASPLSKLDLNVAAKRKECGLLPAERIFPDFEKYATAGPPVHVAARPLEPLEVAPGVAADYFEFDLPALRAPMELRNWLVIHDKTADDVIAPFLDVLTGMTKGSKPTVVSLSKVCSEEFKTTLSSHVTDNTDLVMLVVPDHDHLRTYSIFKTWLLGVYGIPSQAVKEATVRSLAKRGITALSRLVLQMNAKVAGPCWTVKQKAGRTWISQRPTMCIGYCIKAISDTRVLVSLSASLNPDASEYFTQCRQSAVGEMDLVLQNLSKLATGAFAKRNSGVLPTNVIVYRKTAKLQDGKKALAVEYPSIKAGIQTWGHVSVAALSKSDGGPEKKNYEPCVGLVLATQVSSLRFFEESGNDNPSGLAVWDDVTVDGIMNFYLLAHKPQPGCGVTRPAHYFVCSNPGSWFALDIQNTTHLLCCLNYNFPGASRWPAPVSYAWRAAELQEDKLAPGFSVTQNVCTSLYML